MTNTVEINTSVEIPEDVDHERVEMYKQFGNLFEDLFELFIDKNLGYDSSFVTGGVKDTLKGKYDNPVQANIDHIQVRTSDKDDRIDSLNMGIGEERVNEKLPETSGDAAVYRIMQMWLAVYGEDMIPKLTGMETTEEN